MRNRNYLLIASCILAISIIGLSPSMGAKDDPTVVSLLVSMDLPSDATPEQVNASKSNILNIFNAASPYKIDWTLFPTKDAADKTGLLLATFFTGMGGISGTMELGIAAIHEDEKLSSKSYSEQKALLEDSKKSTEALKICGANEVYISGFMPLSFDQNVDTYKVLDDLGIKYSAGFQEGIIYVPGHEEDVWPYMVENHKFYAVPVSTTTLSGEVVPLDDSYMKNNGISASQWYDLLVSKLDDVSDKEGPMVISLSASVSGNGDYLDALNKFLTYAQTKNAGFANAADLVEMSENVHEVAAMSVPAESTEDSSECPTCDSTPINLSSTNDTIYL